MEEVDGIIISRLRQIGCELQNDVKSIKNFTPSDFVEGIIHCLRLINPDSQSSLSSSKLPENVAMRFRFATSLAEAVAGLGYKDKIGYQMILYGSEVDRRRLLMFLIEKLPKEGASSFSIATRSLSVLKNAKRIASERLRLELKSAPAPWFVKTCQSELMNYFWRQPAVDGDVTFQCDRPVASATNLRALRHVPDSVLVINASLYSLEKGTAYPSSEMHHHHDDVSILLHTEQIAAAATAAKVSAGGRVKPIIPPKPSAVRPSTKADGEPEVATTTEEPKLAQEIAISAKESEIQKEKLSQEIASLEMELDEKNAEVSRLHERLNEIKNIGRSTSERLPAKKSSVDQLRLTVQLAANMDEHLKQLRDYIGKSEARLEKLAVTRDDLCAPLLREIAEIKQQNSSQKSESERLMDEIVAIERKASETLSEMDAKKGHLRMLRKEYDRIEKVVNRAYYTKRILEIVANVNKQKQEIERVIKEIHDAQKDVNMLSGKLDRSFTATDELLYKDAMRDDMIKRAYKSFVSLHETCANIISRIENSGHLEREIRDLEDQIDTESQRSVDATLETLVNDYCEMQSANEALFAKLRAAGINI